MSENFPALVRQVTTDVLAHGRTNVETICQQIVDEYPHELALHGDTLARNGLKKLVTGLLRDMSKEETAQLTLPGISLPETLAVPDGDRFTYVRIRQATRHDFDAAIEMRSEHIAASTKVRDHLVRAKDAVDDYWAEWPDDPFEMALKRSFGATGDDAA